MISNRKSKREKEEAVEFLRQEAGSWPGIIPRTTVPKLTGNLYSSGHLANLDSKGKGVGGGFYIGRQRVYPRQQLLDFLISKLEV